jgi:predicted nucleotidyltransferase
MIETLISSKTRIKLLLKFFLNSNTTGYLRNLESEFGDSTNSIRQELNRLEKAGMLNSSFSGNKKIFSANTHHPLFDEIHSIVLKYVGLDRVVDYVIKRLGKVEEVFLVGSFAKGLDSDIIDLVLIGDINKTYLVELIEKAESLIKRKIRYVIYDGKEWKQKPHEKSEILLLWQKDASTA